jgi:hypothetical protein
MTLTQAATKSRTNFSCPSSQAYTSATARSWEFEPKMRSTAVPVHFSSPVCRSRPHEHWDLLRRAVGAARHGPQDGQALGRHLDTVLAEQVALADAPLPTDRSIVQILDSVNFPPRAASRGRLTSRLPGLARMGHEAPNGLR